MPPPDVLGFDPETPSGVRARVLLVLVVAVLGISSSAVLVRLMEAPALSIAAWRTLGAALLLGAVSTRALRNLEPADALAIVAAGAALGLHFWTWFASVQLTTVLRSTLLVALVPAWTALFEWVGLGRRPRITQGIGLAVALPGLTLLAGSGGEASWTGDLLAVGAGILWAIYLLIGRRVRQRVPVGAFMALACAAASGLLFLVGGAVGTPLVGFPGTTWGLIGLALLGPQLLGHQGFAYAVRWLPASTISAIMLLEPVGATALAALVFGETPGLWAVAGAGLVLVGISVATRPDVTEDS